MSRVLRPAALADRTATRPVLEVSLCCIGAVFIISDLGNLSRAFSLRTGPGKQLMQGGGRGSGYMHCWASTKTLAHGQGLGHTCTTFFNHLYTSCQQRRAGLNNCSKCRRDHHSKARIDTAYTNMWRMSVSYACMLHVMQVIHVISCACIRDSHGTCWCDTCACG